MCEKAGADLVRTITSFKMYEDDKPCSKLSLTFKASPDVQPSQTNKFLL